MYVCMYVCMYSVGYQLIGQKNNPSFSPVKIPYGTPSSLNTASR